MTSAIGIAKPVTAATAKVKATVRKKKVEAPAEEIIYCRASDLETIHERIGTPSIPKTAKRPLARVIISCQGSVTGWHSFKRTPYFMRSRTADRAGFFCGADWKAPRIDRLNLENDPECKVIINPSVASIKAELGNLNLGSVVRSERCWESMGADPEVFINNPKTGEVVPAFTFLRSKDEDGEVYWDGFQAEFTVAPYNCLDLLCGAIFRNVDRLRSLSKRHGELSIANTVEISPAVVEASDYEHIKFGCNPSWNAYTREERNPAEGLDPYKVTIRTAGGHIHMSTPGSSKRKKTKTYQGKVFKAVKEMDKILGVISVLMFQHYDSPGRRQYYGRAGEFRFTPYGLEYRVLSNAWLVSPIAFHIVFELARHCLSRVFSPADIASYTPWEASEEEVQECINNCDASLAKEIIKRNIFSFRTILASLPGFVSPNTIEFLEGIVFNGIHTVLENPDKVSSVVHTTSIQYAQARGTTAMKVPN